MEHTCLLPSSQDATTVLCPELRESSAHAHVFKINFNDMLTFASAYLRAVQLTCRLPQTSAMCLAHLGCKQYQQHFCFVQEWSG